MPHIWSNEPVLWLLAAMIKATLILVVAAGLSVLLRNSAARVRHLLWSVALGGALLVPILSHVTPTRELSVLRAAPPALITAASITAPGGAPGGAPGEVEHTLSPLVSKSSEITTAGVVSVLRNRLAGIHWSRWVLSVWAAGTVMVLGSLLLGLLRAYRLGRRARRVISGPWHDVFTETMGRVGLARTVTLKVGGVSAPMTWGVLRPVIVLPDDAGSWSYERRRIVLLHELTHIKRNDWPAQIIARCSCALYWCNPLVWTAARSLALEREKACDDDVIIHGARPSRYARHLLEIAQAMIKTRIETSAAVLSMARHNQLEGRLVSILSQKKNQRSRRRAVLAPLTLLAIMLALTTIQPWGGATAVSEPVPVMEAVGGESDHSSRHWSSGRYHHQSYSDDDAQLYIEVRGDVEFNDDGDKIIHMESRSWVLLEGEGEDGTEFSLEITPDEAGRPEYDWTINGKRADFDDEAKDWARHAMTVLNGRMEMGLIHGERNRLHGEINRMHGDRNRLHGEINRIHGHRNQLKGEINRMHGERNRLHGEINRIHGHKNRLHGEINRIRGHRSSIRGKIKAVASEIKKLRREKRRAESKKERDRIEARMEDLEDDIDELEAEIDEMDAKSEVQMVKERIAALEVASQIEKIKEKIAALEIEPRVQKIREAIQGMGVDGRVEEIEKTIEELKIDDHMERIHEKIEALHVDERVEKIEKRLEPSLRKLKSLMKDMSKRNRAR